MARDRPWIRIIHVPTGTLLAEGKLGWRVLPLEGNLYLSPKSLRGGRWRLRPIPGLCPYKGLYLWTDLEVGGHTERLLGWRYVAPFPWVFFLWNRIGVPEDHPALRIIR